MQPPDTTTGDHTAPRGLLGFDPAEVRAKFDREPFRIAHRLGDHPLLQLPRIVELARSLPEHSVEYNSGALQIGQDPQLTPRTGLGIEETLRRIEECQSWMVLKFIESDPEYGRLLDACLDEIQPAIEAVRPGMFRRRAFLFVSSPGATTPFHADFEHNFLLQIRGGKSIHVWDGDDRTVMDEPERERVVCGGQRNLLYRDEWAARAWRFDLDPGEGVQVPFSSPHWVKVGSEVSVSLSITFTSRHGSRLRALHETNAYLRGRGYAPRPVGGSALVDTLKFGAYRVATRLRRLRGSN